MNPSLRLCKSMYGSISLTGVDYYSDIYRESSIHNSSYDPLSASSLLCNISASDYTEQAPFSFHVLHLSV